MCLVRRIQPVRLLGHADLGRAANMKKQLAKIAAELGKLELRADDAGFENLANSLGCALEHVEAAVEDLKALE